MNGKALLALGAIFGAGLLLGSKKAVAATEEPPAGDDKPPKPKSPTAPKPPSVPAAITVRGPSGNRYTVQRASSTEIPTWMVRSEQFPAVFALVTEDRTILKTSAPTQELTLLESDLDALNPEAFR